MYFSESLSDFIFSVAVTNISPFYVHFCGYFPLENLGGSGRNFLSTVLVF